MARRREHNGVELHLRGYPTNPPEGDEPAAGTCESSAMTPSTTMQFTTIGPTTTRTPVTASGGYHR